ncbi:MAG: carbohydrate kinase [Gammaproteobacteria bacterium]|nr:carbohydrate kinase [Gammaproteobacteria bacterium]MBL6999543.1 carbohydrate kinase [Gammaproteobacteria bacterium]
MISKLCIFGEVLFDHFPDGKSVLGGAPFNVAWHLQAFGLAPVLISQVGDDDAGRKIRQAMTQWQMDSSALNTDQQYATGRVDIKLINDEPEYDIVSPSAWDSISHHPAHAAGCEFLYHGSLALRHQHNRTVLESIMSSKAETVLLDVNLRSPWWNRDQILHMIAACDWLKLNIDELNLLFPSNASLRMRMQALIEQNGLKGILLTRGSAGAELMSANGDWHQVTPDRAVEIVDTVGAGDAFTAVIITGLIRQWPIETTLQRAQLFASKIVGQRGATVAERSFYQTFIQQWSLQ